MSRVLYQVHDCVFCRKVRAALDRLGLEYRTLMVDGADRSIVRQVSGQDLVPVLVDGGEVVSDSTEILRYLVRHDNGAELLPEDARGQSLAWMLEAFADDTLFPVVAGVRAEAAAWPPGDPPAAGAAFELWRWLAGLEGLLAGRDYLLGDSPTLADLALHAVLEELEGEGSRAPIPTVLTRLCSWYGRMRG